MAKRRLRIRWSKILVLVVTVYVAVGASVSAWHWWQLHREAGRLAAQIAAVDRTNRVLSEDLQAVNNPVLLRRMLTGQIPLPSPLWPTKKW
jgi:hypothetical protein